MSVNIVKAFNIDNIHIYDYPGIQNTDKNKATLVMMSFIMNSNFLLKLAGSSKEAIEAFNRQSEYCYNLQIPFSNKNKRYCTNDILKVLRIPIGCGKYNCNTISTKKDYIDDYYYTYYQNRNFYLKLFESIKTALTSYNLLKCSCYVFKLPPQFSKLNIKQSFFTNEELICIYVSAKYQSLNLKLPLPIPDNL